MLWCFCALKKKINTLINSKQTDCYTEGSLSNSIQSADMNIWKELINSSMWHNQPIRAESCSLQFDKLWWSPRWLPPPLLPRSLHRLIFSPVLPSPPPLSLLLPASFLSSLHPLSFSFWSHLLKLLSVLPQELPSSTEGVRGVFLKFTCNLQRRQRTQTFYRLYRGTQKLRSGRLKKKSINVTFFSLFLHLLTDRCESLSEDGLL